MDASERVKKRARGLSFDLSMFGANSDIHAYEVEGLSKTILVVLTGVDYKKYSTLVDYLHNNTTKAQEREELADNYPVVTRKLAQSQRLFGAQEKLDIIAEYSDGALAKELAKKYSCSRETISKLLKEHGITIERRMLSIRGKEDEIVRLYESGLNSYSVAEAAGVSQSSVLEHLRRQGVQLRPAGRQR